MNKNYADMRRFAPTGRRKLHNFIGRLSFEVTQPRFQILSLNLNTNFCNLPLKLYVKDEEKKNVVFLLKIDQNIRFGVH